MSMGLGAAAVALMLFAAGSARTFSILSRYFDHPNMRVRLYAINAAGLFTGIVPKEKMPQWPNRIML